MGQVTVTLNGRSYRLSCGDGDEDRLFRLAEHVRQRIDDLSYQFRSSGDERLLVMAVLMITDELWDTKAKLAALETRLAGQDWDLPPGLDDSPPVEDPPDPQVISTDASHAAVSPKPNPDVQPVKPPAAAPTEPAPVVSTPKTSVVLETSLKRALDRSAGPRVSLSERLAAAHGPRKGGA